MVSSSEGMCMRQNKNNNKRPTNLIRRIVTNEIVQQFKTVLFNDNHVREITNGINNWPWLSPKPKKCFPKQVF